MSLQSNTENKGTCQSFVDKLLYSWQGYSNKNTAVYSYKEIAYVFNLKKKKSYLIKLFTILRKSLKLLWKWLHAVIRCLGDEIVIITTTMLALNETFHWWFRCLFYLSIYLSIFPFLSFSPSLPHNTQTWFFTGLNRGSWVSMMGWYSKSLHLVIPVSMWGWYSKTLRLVIPGSRGTWGRRSVLLEYVHPSLS